MSFIYFLVYRFIFTQYTFKYKEKITWAKYDKINGTWWYINNDAVNFNATTLVKYGNNWYVAAGGKVAWGYTGNMKYNVNTYRVVNGVVRF